MSCGLIPVGSLSVMYSSYVYDVPYMYTCIIPYSTVAVYSNTCTCSMRRIWGDSKIKIKINYYVIDFNRPII